MAKRRSLIAGINTKPKAEAAKEAAFVYGKEKPAAKKNKAAEPVMPPTVDALPPAVESNIPRPTGRTPLTTRIRADLGTGLKRASLERQLSGEKPNTVQDILEEALEPWLRERGYLK